MLIRPATFEDLPSLTALYNHFILHSTAIWDDTQQSLAERESWFKQKQAQQEPILVAIEASTQCLMGYASYAAWRNFTGFKHTVEHSIYIALDHQGKGVGTALMAALIAAARAQHKHAMVACIESSNHASIGLHQKFAFQHIGTFAQVGKKFEQWLDLTCLELVL